MLFRKYVSRKAANKGIAVLEGVGLDAPTIATCFSAYQREEEAVQEGLTKWRGGKGFQPPTWGVLIDAIEYAQIEQQAIDGLKKELSLYQLSGRLSLCVIWRVVGHDNDMGSMSPLIVACCTCTCLTHVEGLLWLIHCMALSTLLASS